MKLLRIKQVAEKTSLAVSTIRNKVCNGTFLKPSKLGKVLVWEESALDDWLSKCLQLDRKES